MTPVKFLLLALIALTAMGCAGGLKRLAPPGIVKYEEIAGDEPMNPAIAETIAEHRTESDGGFPNLAEQPTKVPEGIARPERAAMEDALIDARDDLNEAVTEDRAEAEAERAEPLADNSEQDGD